MTVIDTAGIHETRDPVEKGAGAYAAEAELLLWLVDASSEKSWDHDGAPIWLVRNKIDLNAIRSDTVIDDTVRLRKTFRLLLRRFELLRPANQSQLQAGRGSHEQKRYGPDKGCDDSVQSCLRPPPEPFASVSCTYKVDLFEANAVQKWLAEYGAILAKAVADPERSLGLLMDR